MARDSAFDLDPSSLSGRVAVITGASQGLGAGMAARLAELGMVLGLCARTRPPLPPGAKGVTASVDVVDATAVDDFAQQVSDAYGEIAIWINNAGVLEPTGPQRDHDPAASDRALLVNIGGVANGTRAFTRRARSWPEAPRLLVNISSGAARSVYEGWSIYGATKAAVDHFTEIIDAEEPSVRCHAVAPGVVDTPMQALIRSKSASTFPAVDRFHRLHRYGTWNSPAWVADHVAAIFTGELVPSEVVYRVPDEPLVPDGPGNG